MPAKNLRAFARQAAPEVSQSAVRLRSRLRADGRAGTADLRRRRKLERNNVQLPAGYCSRLAEISRDELIYTCRKS